MADPKHIDPESGLMIYPKYIDHPTEKTKNMNGKEIPLRVRVEDEDEEAELLGTQKAEKPAGWK